jgi:hypothetical protein
VRRSLLVLPPQESDQIPRLNACRVKGRDRAVGQEIFPKTLEMRVMGLIVPVLRYFLHLVERGGVHAA